jgi:hypothetical protein
MSGVVSIGHETMRRLTTAHVELLANLQAGLICKPLLRFYAYLGGDDCAYRPAILLGQGRSTFEM